MENWDRIITHILPKVPDSDLEYLKQQKLEDVLARLLVTIECKLNEWGSEGS